MVTYYRHDVTMTVTPPGGGFVAIQVLDARVTLDEGWSPYAQAVLTCTMPSEAQLELLDPRQLVRIGITLMRGITNQVRGLDLVLTSRVVDHNAGTVTIYAASDEARLQGVSRVATTPDTTARVYMSSLRAMLNSFVLPKIGATLQAGTPDYNATPDIDTVNACTNPRLAVDATGWSTYAMTGSRIASGGPAGCPAFYRGTLASDQPVIVINAPVTLEAGPHVAAIWVRTSLPADLRVDMNGVILANFFGIPANTWTRVYCPIEGNTPAGTATLRLIHDYYGTFPAGMTIDMTGVTVSPSHGFSNDWDYFDGDTVDTATFAYSWAGTAHASRSIRTGLINRSPDLLTWNPGQTAWDFIEPLVRAAGLRLYCDEARRWFLVDPNTPTPGLVNITKAVNLTESRDTVSRFRDWFDAVVIEYRWNTAAGTTEVAWDAAGLSTATNVLKVELDTPYPGPGAAQAILTRSQGRGRVLELRAMPDYAVTPGMSLQATLPGTPVQTGVVSAVTWRIPDDEMDVKSRGLTETPTTSWDALPVGEKWTDSPVGGTWIGE